MEIVTQDPEGGQINIHADEIHEPVGSEVLVKFLATPVNPLDLLVLAGKYPVRPQHHHEGQAIPGYDGVGEIVSCGDGVSTLAPGDIVVPRQFGVGTWRSHAILESSALQKIPRPNDVVFGSLMRLSAGPAYCLIEDMRSLRPGDYVIQNAGTSVIAQFVVQFAQLRGVKVINVIRDRNELEAEVIKKALRESGADSVYTESELADMVVPLRASKRIVLALDAVFGNSGSSLLQSLSDGGTYVQLGFLGGQNGQLPLASGDLFARRLTLRGFRGSAQMASRTPEEQACLFEWWVGLFNGGKLHMPALGLNNVDWDGGQGVAAAVLRARQAKIGMRKQVVVFP